MTDKFFHWFWQVLIAFDQQLNAILFGFADETLSSRAWRAYTNGRMFGLIFKPIIDFITFNPEHCKQAYEAELKRRQLPHDFRDLK